MTYDCMTYDCMTYDCMTYDCMTYDCMTYDCMTYDCMTYDCMTYDCMTYDCMTYDCMTYDCMTYDCMTYDHTSKYLPLGFIDGSNSLYSFPLSRLFISLLSDYTENKRKILRLLLKSFNYIFMISCLSLPLLYMSMFWIYKCLYYPICPCFGYISVYIILYVHVLDI